jgi:hypothetical protein
VSIESTGLGSIGRKAAQTIREFCADHSISRAEYYKLKKLGKGPREMVIGSVKRISAEASADWRKDREAGVSANPGGRPAVVRELRDAAQVEGLNCIQTLIAIRDNPKFPPITRIAACNNLLDRGYGRPVQGVAVANLPAVPEPSRITEQMTHQEAAQAYADTLKQGQRDLDNLMSNEGPPIIDVVPNKSEDESGS